MDLANKKVLIVGLGLSGVAAARFAKKRAASVTVTDIAGDNELIPYVDTVRKLNVNLELGQHNIETFEQADLIIVSPGVSHTILPIKRAKEKGVPVLGELELASRYITEPIVAISGTNGKTTTTTLLGNMLKNSGCNVFVGGNIGNPLLDYADKSVSSGVVVAEVSSFQLDTIDTFKPRVSVLLNISADHLDRYSNFEDYVKSKGRIFENQQGNDTAIFNAADPLIRSISKDLKARKLPFHHQGTIQRNTVEGAIINWDDPQNQPNIMIYTNDTGKKSINLSQVKLPGRHNMENVAAASLAALTVGGTLDGVQSAVNDFRGLSHRMEYVGTINNVQFFDDSKATNVDAVARALETFSKPVVLIMGGRDKGGDFQHLRDLVRRQTKKLILMGEAKGEIKYYLESACKGGAQTASTIEDAVLLAYKAATPGDVVLLSPACSSFDMYSSYAERGEAFCGAVKYLNETGQK